MPTSGEGTERQDRVPSFEVPSEEVRWRGRVLIRLPNWVGDAVMAAPAILGLAEALPDWEWCLLGGRRSLPLFEGLDIPFRRLPELVGRGRRPRPLLRAVGHLRRERFSAALILPPSFSSALMVFAAGIPLRLGWPTDRRTRLLTDPAQPPSRLRPLRDQYLDLAEQLLERLAPHDQRWKLPRGPRRIPLTAEELVWADRWWDSRGWRAEGTLVLAPGATFGATKRWPEDRFLELAQRLGAEGWNLLWLGGEEERELCGRLAGEVAGSLSVAGDLTLRQSMALLSKVGMAVSNDSGAMHLAQAAGAPVVGIFGSTSPLWTGPAGETGEAVSLTLPCAPCFSKVCPTQIECLRDLSVAQVHQAYQRLRERVDRTSGQKAVFLDRDGTVLELVPYLTRIDATRLQPGAAAGLKRLKSAGFALVVITNQSAVARGLITPDSVYRIHRQMESLLLQEGVKLDGIEVCPHHPDFTGPCACRKPEPGMPRRAAHRLDLDLGRSFMVGDSVSDLEAGRRAGTRTILVRSGYGAETEAVLRSGGSSAGAELKPDAVCDDLLGAAEWIVDRGGDRG